MALLLACCCWVWGVWGGGGMSAGGGQAEDKLEEWMRAGGGFRKKRSGCVAPHCVCFPSPGMVSIALVGGSRNRSNTFRLASVCRVPPSSTQIGPSSHRFPSSLVRHPMTNTTQACAFLWPRGQASVSGPDTYASVSWFAWRQGPSPDWTASLVVRPPRCLEPPPRFAISVRAPPAPFLTVVLYVVRAYGRRTQGLWGRGH